jgi:hypothetical protein
MTTDSDRVDELQYSHSGVTVVPHYFDATGEAGWRVVLSKCDDLCTHGGEPKIRILTVHHLDGHKANNAWWNLLALCQVCHLQIQGKVIPEQPYLWPHTPWFIPYACGFYAHYHAGLTITRQEADADPLKYLRMGQPWLYAKVEFVGEVHEVDGFPVQAIKYDTTKGIHE